MGESTPKSEVSKTMPIDIFARRTNTRKVCVSRRTWGSNYWDVYDQYGSKSRGNFQENSEDGAQVYPALSIHQWVGQGHSGGTFKNNSQ
ncbi:hypothetical protein V6N11_034744 [Hibiscus sabdariffa]|uniref:Uncharacterized protein n=2 Tax=Hibiscus sabdariffa TaxID=183260 RepID=A0ABR2NRN9_9ROSI